MKRTRVIFLALSLVLTALLPPSAAMAAPVVYTYIGNPFDTFVNHDHPVGIYDNTNHLEMVLTTIDGYLPDNLPGQDITPYLSSWEISDGRYKLTHTHNYRLYYMYANVTGQSIVSWSFGFWFNDTRPGDPTSLGSRVLSSNNPQNIGDRVELYHWWNPNGYSFDAGSVSSNGAWNMSAGPIPEPATMLLLGIGLGWMAWVRRKL